MKDYTIHAVIPVTEKKLYNLYSSESEEENKYYEWTQEIYAVIVYSENDSNVVHTRGITADSLEVIEFGDEESAFYRITDKEKDIVEPLRVKKEITNSKQ